VTFTVTSFVGAVSSPSDAALGDMADCALINFSITYSMTGNSGNLSHISGDMEGETVGWDIVCTPARLWPTVSPLREITTSTAV
jgi:hypothetical protein